MNGANTNILSASIPRVFRSERDRKGLLVTVSGFDGSGKTTQIEALAQRFRDLGRTVIVTRQPTDWYRNEKAVQQFHASGGAPYRARVLALFAAADRLRHIEEVVDPALADGAVVISDRYVFATFAVFTHRGVDFEFLVTINQGVPKPDYAFYLDVPTPVLLQRLSARDGADLKHEEKSTQRIDSIKSKFEAMREHLHFIDGAAPADAVTDRIFGICGPRPVRAAV